MSLSRHSAGGLMGEEEIKLIFDIISSVNRSVGWLILHPFCTGPVKEVRIMLCMCLGVFDVVCVYTFHGRRHGFGKGVQLWGNGMDIGLEREREHMHRYTRGKNESVCMSNFGENGQATVVYTTTLFIYREPWRVGM
jgi:hypothetical protein